MSSNRKEKKRRHGYRHVNVPITNPIRVRSKRLDQVDEDKIALAFWLLAKQMVADRTEPGGAETGDAERSADQGEQDDASKGAA